MRALLRFVAVSFALALAAQDSVPVLLDGREVFRFRVPLGPIQPGERAEAASSHLATAARSPGFRPDKILTIRFGPLIAVISEQHVPLATFSEDDARAEALTLDALGGQRAAAIRTAIQAFKDRRRWSLFVRSAVIVSVAWILFGGLVWGLRLASRRVRVRIRAWRLQNVRKARPRGFQFFWERVAEVSVAAVRIVAFFLMLAVMAVLISVSLSMFPVTEPFAHEVYGYLSAPLVAGLRGLLQYLPNFGVLLVLAVFTFYLVRLLRVIARGVESGAISLPGFYPDWAPPTYKAIAALVVAFACVVGFPYLPGAGSPAFQGISIFIGVLISFGSGSLITNLLAGFMITYMRPYHIGHWVKIGDSVGEVIGRSLLVTRIRTVKNEEIIVPNSLILNTNVVNYSTATYNQPVIFHTTVTIGYDAPWRTVHQLLIAAARDTKWIVQEPAPFVLQTSLNDFHISYQINAYTRNPHEMVNIYSELHQNIQESFNKAGVEIMSPTFYALRDGNTVTTPAAHRPPGYQAPAFRLEEIYPPEGPGA